MVIVAMVIILIVMIVVVLTIVMMLITRGEMMIFCYESDDVERLR
jgi:hypothetical protein